MKPFELCYLCAEPFLPFLQSRVRRHLLALTRAHNGVAPLELLDVGGRKSHYTINVPARVTILDLPRENEVQMQLHLGIPVAETTRIRTRRSNVSNIVFDDMTRCSLPDNSFDLVVAVEVLEHVETDEAFVRQVQRVLKPGGAFLMTTPNGDFIPYRPEDNPDHKRLYRREQLRQLLAAYFAEVDIEYAVRDGQFFEWGLRSWSPRHPVRTLLSMTSNVINHLQSIATPPQQWQGTIHLLAAARKAADGNHT
jgi:SAM-dependent methyltransferase